MDGWMDGYLLGGWIYGWVDGRMKNRWMGRWWMDEFPVQRKKEIAFHDDTENELGKPRPSKWWDRTCSRLQRHPSWPRAPDLCPPCPAACSSKFHLNKQVGPVSYVCCWPRDGAFQGPGPAPSPLPPQHLEEAQLPCLPFLAMTPWTQYSGKMVPTSGLLLCMCAQLYLALCEPMDCDPPGSSVHRILQARILERVAMSSSRGSSQSRD